MLYCCASVANPREVMAALPPFSLLNIRRWADSLGAAGAFLCALHCALLPLALLLWTVALRPVLDDVKTGLQR